MKTNWYNKGKGKTGTVFWTEGVLVQWSSLSLFIVVIAIATGYSC